MEIGARPAAVSWADSYHAPLTRWGLAGSVPPGVQFHLRSRELPTSVEAALTDLRKPLIAVAASAAWEMKRWPVEHWCALIRQLGECSFVLLGGPGDVFLEEIRAVDRLRVISVAGLLSLDQSSAVLTRADLVISNDTGILHVADQMERPTIALIGPSAFGYPSHATSVTMEKPLWCQPCSKDGRGGCVNDLYKRCLVELTPDLVAAQARSMLGLK